MASAHRGPALRLLQAAVGVAYVLLMVWVCSQPRVGWWSLLPLVGLMVLGVVAWLCARLGLARWRLAVQAAVMAALCGLGFWMARTPPWNVLDGTQVRLVYLLQESLLYGLVLLVFVRSLQRGHTPLCTVLATALHPVMSPRVVRYTRAVTIGWVGVLGLLWLASVALFVLASPQVWAVFSGLVAPVLLALVFPAEVMLRRCWLPPADRLGVRATIAAARSIDWPRLFRDLLPAFAARPAVGDGSGRLPSC